MAIDKFQDTHLEEISKILGNVATGSEISRLFEQCNIEEVNYNPMISRTKWVRIYDTLKIKQNSDCCGNYIGAFIQAAMDPVRFVKDKQRFFDYLNDLNLILIFQGLKLQENGKLIKTQEVDNISDAQKRCNFLKNELENRNVHFEIIKFCIPELLADNYFHAVLEATKSITQKIRDKTGLKQDGAELIDIVFSIKDPILAINKLQEESEKSEHKGFANLLKGIIGTFRNVTAHSPKLYWNMSKEDALDLMQMVSYAHRKLDLAVLIPKYNQ